MMQRLILISLIIFSFNLSQAQNLILYSSRGSDTINVCENQTVTFYAFLINNTDTLDCYMTWDMDDGTVLTGQNLDTVRYAFRLNRGHRIWVYATYGDTTYAAEILVRVGLKPNFSGTKANLPDKQLGICNGDEVQLIGRVKDSAHWKEEPVHKYIEPVPFEINQGVPYSNYITRKDFELNLRLSDSSQIDSIGMLIVHPDAAELRITLTAPSGDSIVLKDFGGNHNSFGQPDQGTNGAQWYFWACTADSTINQLTLHDSTIPAGAYRPEQCFSLLSGTPFNGRWTITVRDNNTSNSGYVLGWAIFFNPQIVSDTFQYVNYYNLSQAFWNGDNVNLTSEGVSSAYPSGYGDHRYTFYVQDNFQCSHDTAIFVTVEQPDFEVDKRTVTIGDSIQVKDITTWAVDHLWDFGDQSPAEQGEVAYHKYMDKGRFLITLTAYSQSGCSDIDTMWIEAVPKPIKLPNYNVFTPNGDGVNDVFSFFTKPEDKITAYNIEKIDGRIYDRDGKLVCHWTTPEEAIAGWDGTVGNNGKIPASEGVYYYIIIIKGKDGKDYPPFTGYIYLHR